jgi:hypothetical protein
MSTSAARARPLPASETAPMTGPPPVSCDNPPTGRKVFEERAHLDMLGVLQRRVPFQALDGEAFPFGRQLGPEVDGVEDTRVEPLTTEMRSEHGCR